MKKQIKDLIDLKFNIGDEVFIIRNDAIRKEVVRGYEITVFEAEVTYIVLLGDYKGKPNYRVSESEVRSEAEMISFIQKM